MTLGGRRFLLSMAIIAASISLALGLTLPGIRLTRFYFFSTEYSLISTVYTLLSRNQMFLGTIVFIFSIMLPVFKLGYLVVLTTMPDDILREYRHVKALEWLGKWSMHDVLVLALMIFFIKSQGVYDAKSLPGVYFFTAAVLLMILAYTWLNRLTSPRGASDRSETGTSTGAPLRRETPAWRNFLLALFILVAAILFALGVILPSIRFTTVYVWTNEHSIATILWALYHNQEWFLCAVIGIFSVVFPFLKLLYLLTLCLSPSLSSDFRQKSISTIEWLGRYSMTDVMVLALMIFYMNSSGYTEARVMPGIYCFAASALMTMVAYGWANTPAQRRGKPASLARRLAVIGDGARKAG